MTSLIRSKERVAELGEVFTPEHIVVKMHKQIDSWADPTMIYLEPTCGDGQFVREAVQRKLDAGLSPYEAVNTVFGMDIMHDNIQACQLRVLGTVIRHLEKEGLKKGDSKRTAIIREVLMIIAHNIFRVPDSLKFMSSGKWERYPFLQKDPTGSSAIVHKGSRQCQKAFSIARKIQKKWEDTHVAR